MNKRVPTFLLMLLCVCGPASRLLGCDQLPIALMSPDGPLYVAVGTSWYFSDDGSYDPDGGSIQNWFWCYDFGGFAIETSNTTCTFNNPGVHEIELYVKDDDGDWSDGWDGYQSTYPQGYDSCSVCVFNVQVTNPLSNPYYLVCAGGVFLDCAVTPCAAVAGTYSWTASPSSGASFSDPHIKNPIFIVTDPGTYTVTVKYTVPNGTRDGAIASDSITIVSPPTTGYWQDYLPSCGCPLHFWESLPTPITDDCGDSMAIHCDSSNHVGFTAFSWWYYAVGSGGTEVGVCVWPGGLNSFQYKACPREIYGSERFLQTYHVTRIPQKGIYSGYGCTDYWCSRIQRHDCVTNGPVTNQYGTSPWWRKSTESPAPFTEHDGVECHGDGGGAHPGHPN
jgi:hypothetical protein